MPRKRRAALPSQVQKHLDAQEPLVKRHRLVSALTMAEALQIMHFEAMDDLGRGGDGVVEEWMKREMYREYCHMVSAYEMVLPKAPSRVIRECCADVWQRGVPDVLHVAGCHNHPFLAALEWLDRQKGISPALLAVTDEVELRGEAAAMRENGHFVAVSDTVPLTAPREALPRVGYVFGMELDEWHWEGVEGAVVAEQLAAMSPRELKRALETEAWLRPTDGRNWWYWDIVWRKKRAALTVLGDSPHEQGEGDLEEPVAREMVFPEFAAMPFYDVEQIPRLYEGLVMARVCISVLGQVCDADFRRGIMRELRRELGYRRIETRGRRRPPPDEVERIGQLVLQREWAVNRVWRELGVPRSTTYDRLAEYRRRHSRHE